MNYFKIFLIKLIIILQKLKIKKTSFISSKDSQRDKKFHFYKNNILKYNYESRGCFLACCKKIKLSYNFFNNFFLFYFIKYFVFFSKY